MHKEITFTASMVKPLRNKLGMTQESLAYIVGCGPRSISQYETKGKTNKIHRSIRNGFIRLMEQNNITEKQLEAKS
jgi:DNA-binding XRE family transcriptional regulator